MSTPFIAEIRMFAGNFAPRSWMFCQGQILSIASNTALFSLLGTTYGGNGQTTFALPDFRGRVPVGTGSGPGLPPVSLGEMAGSYTQTLLATNMPAHTHTATTQLKGTSAAANQGKTDGAVFGSNDNLAIYTRNAGSMDMNFNAASATTTVSSAGGNQPFSLMQPYLGMNFIIAIEGIYPSRN